MFLNFYTSLDKPAMSMLVSSTPSLGLSFLICKMGS